MLQLSQLWKPTICRKQFLTDCLHVIESFCTRSYWNMVSERTVIRYQIEVASCANGYYKNSNVWINNFLLFIDTHGSGDRSPVLSYITSTTTHLTLTTHSTQSETRSTINFSVISTISSSSSSAVAMTTSTLSSSNTQPSDSPSIFFYMTIIVIFVIVVVCIVTPVIISGMFWRHHKKFKELHTVKWVCFIVCNGEYYNNYSTFSYASACISLYLSSTVLIQYYYNFHKCFPQRVVPWCSPTL